MRRTHGQHYAGLGGIQGERTGRMIFRWLQRRRESRALVASDAASLMQNFGASAYHVARDKAADVRRRNVLDGDRDHRHWDRVRREIARRTKRSTTDTATRFLED